MKVNKKLQKRYDTLNYVITSNCNVWFKGNLRP